MKNAIFKSVVIVVLFSCLEISQAGEWRFGPTLSYKQSLGEIYDLYIDNLENEGYAVSSKFYLPVGVSFQPYYEFDFGLRLGGGIGPIVLVYISKDLGDNSNFFDLPVNLNVGYTIIPPFPVSPYVKVGFVHHVATGDYFKSVDPGLFVAGGIEFLRKKRACFGIEVSYDYSEAIFENNSFDSYWDYQNGVWVYADDEKNIRIGGLLISLYVAF